MTCPNCGAAEQEGKFCAECGAALRSDCAECGADLEPGARFCHQCGADSRPGEKRSLAPWWIAATAALVVLLILMIPQRTDRAGPLPMTDPDAPAPAPAPGAPAGAGFTGDMRTDADRLFNRVMAAAEQDRQEEVDRFMPMAIQAYGLVPALDHDGLFHLAILHQTAGDHASARATAHQILQDAPNHILGLGVAGTSAAAEDDDAAARSHFQRLVDAYPSESGRLAPEYVDHQPMLDEYLRIARAHLARP